MAKIDGGEMLVRNRIFTGRYLQATAQRYPSVLVLPYSRIVDTVAGIPTVMRKHDQRNHPGYDRALSARARGGGGGRRCAKGVYR